MFALKKILAETPLSQPLGHAPHGFKGRIKEISNSHNLSSLGNDELESRLIELGFIEGALVEILHQGGFRKDPIAVRVNNTTIALRRCEAMAIWVS